MVILGLQETWTYGLIELRQLFKKRQTFEEFGMPVFDMTAENFLLHPVWDVFTFCIPPVAIDIMIKLEGLDFASAYLRSIVFRDEEIEIRTIHKNDLITTKQRAGRSKDLDDLENLQ
jgi:hypothetical protein